MDPYVHMAYLCFLENSSMIRKAFKKWSHKTNPHASLSFGDFKFALQQEADTKKWTARYAFIFEQEEKWNKFNAHKFIRWLEGMEFRK